MTTLQYSVPWGNFPDQLRDIVLPAIERGRMETSSWDDLQKCIAEQFRQEFPADVLENVPISQFEVAGSKAEIDIVLGDLADRELGGFLIHVSGHMQPRHEKELLEMMAVSTVDQRFSYAVLVVCSDNKLRLEGRATSYEYCIGPLIRLAYPVLERCNLKGLLVVGLSTPSKSITH
jgi:hypothetical protein